MSFTHLNLFYDSRSSNFIQNSSPVNNPNTQLSDVPQKATIHFEYGSERLAAPSEFDHPKAEKVARFLIERALLDPDATVVPV